MGLDFHVDGYECNFRWGYTAFHFFRKKIADKLGLNYEVTDDWKYVNKEWSGWDKYWLLFLTHSDFDGTLSPKECGKIAKRMRRLITTWDVNDIDYSRLIKLVEAMEHCKDHEKELTFC
jgi:hypothetical protein